MNSGLQELPQRFLQMDDEGYFSSQGQRVTEESYGLELMNSIARDENGTFLVDSYGTKAILEAFDEPLVVQFVEKLPGGEWKILLPYGAEKKFKLESLTLDDWDRFHGHTLDALPFVLSRKAQAEFFNLLDEFDDDSFTVDGKTYPTPFWLNETPEPRKESFWTEIYKNESRPGWDMDGAAPALPVILPQLKIPRSRVLVLGAGRAHDAAFFAEQGHIVTAVDISQEAIDQAKKRYGHLANLKFELQDIFKLPESWRNQFDLIFEHTCYCAIPPRMRTDLVKVWKSMLAPGGHVLGVFFAMDRPNGPPFGGSEWELRERFKNSFQFLYWMRWRQSHPRRQGREVVIYMQKK